MKQLSIMMKPASSLCNMRCSYCFYANIADLREVHSYGLMSEDTVEKILDNIFRDMEDGDRLTLAFQGGEPTLAGLEWYKRFVQMVSERKKRVRIAYALQTNGLLLNDEWCEFLAQHRFLVGLSLDLLQESHDSMRLDDRRMGTYKRIIKSMECMNRHGVEYNVLCTLTNQTAKHPQKVWNQIKKLDIAYIQFTPCLDDLDNAGESLYALTPKRFAEFYKTIFDLWYQDYQAGQYRSIKLFDDLVQLLAKGIITACGLCGKCNPQIIIEADGSVYPCDFYCLDQYCIGNLREEKLQDVFKKSVASPTAKREPLPKFCYECPYLKICGGNCKRMQHQICFEEGKDYCGYRSFLDDAIGRLQQIAWRYR